MFNDKLSDIDVKATLQVLLLAMLLFVLLISDGSVTLKSPQSHFAKVEFKPLNQQHTKFCCVVKLKRKRR